MFVKGTTVFNGKARNRVTNKNTYGLGWPYNMDIVNLGIKSRKTGIEPKSDLKRDQYGMEDVDDFFADDSDFDISIDRKASDNHTDPNHVARRIEFNQHETESFDLSPIMSKDGTSPSFANDTNEQPLILDNNDNNDFASTFDNAYDNELRFDDFDDIATVEKSPLSDTSPTQASPSNKIISNLTKKMALGKSRRGKTRRKLATTNSEIISAISKPSPLPSPPPDGLRRSKRTRITPLAYWRGERIIYSRANDYIDPDTTLGGDIHKIPLQEIKEVVHVNVPSPSPSSKKRKRLSVAKFKKKNSKLDLEYDYESDPEVIGSEWYTQKQLEVEVFDGPNSEHTKKELVAHTMDFDELQEPKGDGIDNYKMGPLFKGSHLDSATTNILASAIFEFPLEGFKSVRRSDHCTYLFHVMKGLVEVQLSNSKFAVTRGCTFKIPSFNSYGITNIGNGQAKLFCVQVLTDPPS